MPLPLLRKLVAPVVTAVLVAALSSCSPQQRGGGDGVPLFEGLGNHGRRISTASPDAQRYFDQGLNLLFAFNHDEAIRSFRRATELDPHAAMAWWGIAIASGPHINNPMMTPASSSAAWGALQRASAEAAVADPAERELIVALASRYTNPAPADRASLDLAYADAMRRVWHNHQDDADIGALFAEAMMDLRPWNQWTPEGTPEPGTAEVLTTLETVLRTHDDHPLALHLYIHAVEASRTPFRGDGAAARLRSLHPALGHLVHMPSHIDVRRGRWQQAIEANRAAIVADDRYHAVVPHQGLYGLYMAHNHHMLAFAAMMIGHRAEATQAIDTIVAAIPPDWARQYAPIADGFLAMPLEVRMRFGAWKEILAAPEPDATYPFARAMRHYARGVAFAATGDAGSARVEQVAFSAARAALPADSRFGNNHSADLLAVADRVLEGEVSWREGKRDAAIAALRRAVELEDALHYDEPPSWILPTRHTLGAALLDAGLAADAEKVFRDDLAKLPNNGWSLFGLAKSLRLQKNDEEAERVEDRFDSVWADADYRISSPCACLAPQ